MNAHVCIKRNRNLIFTRQQTGTVFSCYIQIGSAASVKIKRCVSIQLCPEAEHFPLQLAIAPVPVIAPSTAGVLKSSSAISVLSTLSTASACTTAGEQTVTVIAAVNSQAAAVLFLIFPLSSLRFIMGRKFRQYICSDDKAVTPLNLLIPNRIFCRTYSPLFAIISFTIKLVCDNCQNCCLSRYHSSCSAGYYAAVFLAVSCCSNRYA